MLSVLWMKMKESCGDVHELVVKGDSKPNILKIPFPCKYKRHSDEYG